jgi:diguanylate cyclase (GGDEF)-like protein/PAS domain S-box-containing protein
VQKPKPRSLEDSADIPSAGRQAVDDVAGAMQIARVVTDSYPGPALYVDATGDVVVANAAGQAFADFLQSNAGEALRSGIAGQVSQSGAGNMRISFKSNNTERTLELTLTHIHAAPNADDDGVLVLGRDITGERNVINALVSSRQLYRDLVECSADFGWETDINGAFSYVSPQGGFGFNARELNGMLASTLVSDPDSASAFSVRHRYRNVEVWLRRKDGSRGCVVVSAVPVHDAHGRWIGTRGMCRDVTAVKAHLLQENILSRIVDAMRNCVDPREALETAALQIVEVFSPARSLVAKNTEQGFELAANHGFDASGAAKALARCATVLEEAVAGSNRPIVEYSDAVTRVLAAPSYHHGAANGVVLIERDISEGPWSDQERHLLSGIVDQFGIAIEQVNSFNALEDLSRTDEMTGLLNRRAFAAAVAPRMLHQRRTGRVSTLLYLDLDNFKAVNDVLGHQEGDRVLRRIGEMIRTRSRAGDMAARVGGDEFLIWLEDTELDGAIAKAQSLIRDIADFQVPARSTAESLGLSVGVAVSDPVDPVALEGLIERADQAMYEAKRQGKKGLSIFVKEDQAKAC